MADISRTAMVNYYRCEHCGCIWNVRKADPSQITIVYRRGSKPPGSRSYS